MVPITLLLLFAGGIAPVALALLSQYGFGMYPCELCIYQRIPYSMVGVLSVLALFWLKKPIKLRWLIKIALLLWVIEAGIAFYHVGVEQAWWDSATGCTAESGTGQSVDDIRAAILNSPLVSCSDVAFSLLGLSMAAWNVIAAFGLFLLGFGLLRKGDWHE